MPGLSKDDLALLRTVADWRDTATDEYYDIEGWREAAGERDRYADDPTRAWGEMPNLFYTRTSHLVGWINAKYPRLDFTPLQDIYSAVAAWHEDHNAGRVGPQGVLRDKMDRAMQVLQAVEMEIYLRAQDPQTASGVVGGQPEQEARPGFGQAVVAELRRRACRLRSDAPQPDSLESKPNQSKRLAKEFAEGGRLLLAAVEAGAFTGDALIGELVGRYRKAVKRKEEAGFRDALAYSRLELFTAFEQRWLPQRRPDLAKELSGGGYSVHAYERYAKVMDFLADLIEEGSASPDDAFGSYPGGAGAAGQGEARLPRESVPEKSSRAGAHPAISPNEDGLETPIKVRTDGAQVRTSAPLPFDEARRQALLWLDHLGREVVGAPLGHELALTYGIESRIAGLLAQLGLRRAPITRRSELVGADGRPIPDDAELPHGATLELRHWTIVEDPVIGLRSSRYQGQRGPRKDGQQGVEGTRGGVDDEGFRADLLRALDRWRTYVEAMSPPTAETLALAVHDWREALQAAEEYRALLSAFHADAAGLDAAQADARTEQARAAYIRLTDRMERFDLAAKPRLETAGLPPGPKYVHDDGRPRPFKVLLADALARIDGDMLTLKECLAEAEASARRASANGMPLSVDGVSMPENTEPRAAGRPAPVDRMIERLIADVENWIRPRPAISLGGYDPYLDQQAEECEKSRDNAVQSGKAIAAALVERGESARAVFTILNALEANDGLQARKDWQAVKPELQEAATRARLQEQSPRARQSPDAGRPRPKVDPLDRAILDMLDKLPLHWGTVNTDDLTATEQQALKLLTRAGLVENRIRVRAWTDGFPQTVNMQFRVSGEYPSTDLVKEALHAVPEWLDGEGRLRGGFTLQSNGVFDVRLTDQGELAKHDYDTNTADNPSFVLAFIRGIGPMGLPRPGVKGTVVAEYCRVETAQEDHRPAKRASREESAPASANATGGDITVHNHINIDPGAIADLVLKKGAIADLVLKKLAEEQAAPAVAQEAPQAPAGQAPPAAEPPGQEDAQEVSARTDWRDVQERLLRLRDAGEPFTSQRDLAKRMSCSAATINKAVNDSALLKGWAARAKGSPKAQSLNEVTGDSTPSRREPDPADYLSDDDVDRTMAKLIQQTDDPEKRAELNRLDDDGRRKLAKLCLEQEAEMRIEDEAPGGNRILGRKP